MNARSIARYTFREILGNAVMGVALFWAAGRIDWWPGWAILAVTMAWTLATAAVILRFNPNLLAERLGPRRGSKGWWDTAIMSLLGLSQLARYIVAGLDQRFNRPGDFPLSAQIAGLGLCILGYALFVWATASNAFFSQIVCIQPERGHRAAMNGPYHFVHHPGYVGGILVEIGAPILLDSTWALIPSAIGAGLLILRTFLEDRTLQRELTGYADYTHKVHHRLVPGAW